MAPGQLAQVIILPRHGLATHQREQSDKNQPMRSNFGVRPGLLATRCTLDHAGNAIDEQQFAKSVP